jgi:hypothetical protein
MSIRALRRFILLDRLLPDSLCASAACDRLPEERDHAAGLKAPSTSFRGPDARRRGTRLSSLHPTGTGQRAGARAKRERGDRHGAGARLHRLSSAACCAGHGIRASLPVQALARPAWRPEVSKQLCGPPHERRRPSEGSRCWCYWSGHFLTRCCPGVALAKYRLRLSQTEQKKLLYINILCGTAGGIRTTDLLIHSQAL